MEKKQGKLTGNYRSLLYALWRKRDYWCKRNKLAPDGSFTYTDKRLAEEQEVSTKTIARAKKFLVENGYITIRNGFTGNATKYWMLIRPQRGGTFKPLGSVDNLSKVGDILSKSTPQSVHLNKGSNKESNKEDSNNVSNDENLKNGLLGLIKTKGVEYSKEFYLRVGFLEGDIDKALDQLRKDGLC